MKRYKILMCVVLILVMTSSFVYADDAAPFTEKELVNYGALGIMLAYFVYKDNSTMKDFRKTMEDFKEMLIIIKEGVCK